ncbi:MAG: hypothetical protein FJ104_17130, partial [Deltaproteobacteria bacterium]|nr:hypothetical protein [Deltaproteobacteria bacterium]
FAEPATQTLGWTTDGGPLELCTLPSAVVLELGASILEDARVAGMILNPFDDGELLLRRHEVASLAAGKPLPLVGYVEALPLDEDESRLVAEMDGPPPAEVTAAIEQVLAGTSGAIGHRLYRTMNPERDLEPHLTLNVLVEDDDLDRGALATRLAAALDGKLPPPGYIDIVFNDPTLR